MTTTKHQKPSKTPDHCHQAPYTSVRLACDKLPAVTCTLLHSMHQAASPKHWGMLRNSSRNDHTAALFSGGGRGLDVHLPLQLLSAGAVQTQ
jgi:hypothetical protein